ncbi:MAG: hypothetical protein HY013_06935 [Candidatus Solibacter usitatus]|nr:hypothetical protein [Candidatus Solibacter usitatus]
MAGARLEGALGGLAVKAALNDRAIQDVLSRAEKAGLSQSELAQLKATLRGLPVGKAAAEVELIGQLLDGPGPRRAIQAYMKVDELRRQHPDRLTPQMTRWICESAGRGLLNPTRDLELGHLYYDSPVGHDAHTAMRTAWMLCNCSPEYYAQVKQLLDRTGGTQAPPADALLERAMILREVSDWVTSDREGHPYEGYAHKLQPLADRIRGANPESYYPSRDASPFGSASREAQALSELAELGRDPEARIRELMGRLAQYGLKGPELAQIENLIRQHPGNTVAGELKLVNDLLNGPEARIALQTYVELGTKRFGIPGRMTPELVREFCEAAPRLYPKDSHRLDKLLKAAEVMCGVSNDWYTHLTDYLRHAGEDGGPKSDAASERAMIFSIVARYDKDLVAESQKPNGDTLSITEVRDAADRMRGKDVEKYFGIYMPKGFEQPGPAKAAIGLALR